MKLRQPTSTVAPAGAPLAPPRYKIAILSWLAIFPLITLLFALLGPLLSPLPLVLRTLLITLLVSPLMTYVVMPWLLRRFAWWLAPNSRLVPLAERKPREE